MFKINIARREMYKIISVKIKNQGFILRNSKNAETNNYYYRQGKYRLG
jgi:hypothetical protein